MEVEVIVSDNASTDGTKEYMEELVQRGKLKNLCYHRNDENIGPDNNFVMCYKLAKGDYIWLLGDDDMIMGDIVLYITEILEKYSPGVVFIDFTIEKVVRSQKSEVCIDDGAVVCNDYMDFLLRMDYMYLISAFICKKEIIETIVFSKYVRCKELKYVLAILKCAFESEANVVVAGKNYLKAVQSFNTWDRYETMWELGVLVNSIRYEEEKELYYWFARKMIYGHKLSTYGVWNTLGCRVDMPETSLRWNKSIALDTLENNYPVIRAGYEWLMECPIEEIGISRAVEKFQEIKKESIVDIAKKFKIIYIYGAGYWGKYYKQLLADNGVDINGFLVSDDEEITGENIYHLSEVPPTEAAGVLVAVQYGRKVFDILRNLLASEWKNRMDDVVFIV